MEAGEARAQDCEDERTQGRNNANEQGNKDSSRPPNNIKRKRLEQERLAYRHTKGNRMGPEGSDSAKAQGCKDARPQGRNDVTERGNKSGSWPPNTAKHKAHRHDNPGKARRQVETTPLSKGNKRGHRATQAPHILSTATEKTKTNKQNSEVTT